jgi:pimeloyl-ACP methyl ester carboxylesterase
MPTIQRDGRAIAYDAVGQGPCVLMVHSFLCDRKQFRHQVAALRMRWRVISVDMRGHGDSGDADQPFTLYDLVDDLLAVLDAERVRSAVWVGSSVGGMLAMRAAIRHPERVSALVLMNTEARPETLFGAVTFGVLRLTLLLVGAQRLARLQLTKFLGRTTMREQPALVEELCQQFKAARVASVAEGMLTLIRRDDLFPSLGDIECPSLVITGDEDRAMPRSASLEIARRIPRAELQVLPRCGHLSSLEAPQAVNQALLEFLGRIEVAPRAA